MKLGFDPAAAVRHLCAADPVLGAVIAEVGPLDLQLSGAPTTFAALSQAIVYQQLHGRAAAAIYARLLAAVPGSRSGAPLRAEDVLALSDETLRGAGLSQAKTRSLRDLAEKVVEGTVPGLDDTRAMDDESIIDQLSQVRGIGRWSAEMFLMFTLGRPDVLPAGDFGVRHGFALVFGHPSAPTPKELLAYGERWRPFRTAASWYLWRAVERDSKSRSGGN